MNRLKGLGRIGWVAAWATAYATARGLIAAASAMQRAAEFCDERARA